MSELPISEEALRAAEAAFRRPAQSVADRGIDRHLEMAIRAFLHAEGFEVERRAAYTKGKLRLPHSRGPQPGSEWKRVEPLRRLISKWVIDA